MESWTEHPLRTLEDVARFEAAGPLEQRLPGRSVFDVFVAAAQRFPKATAITMVMTGAPDEEPRRVNYAELLALVRRAANLFAQLGGKRPGVAYMLPSLVETHATLWGAETAGYAVPINFLLQPAHIAELLKASGAKILVALGPHPQLDIWQKALQLREQVPGLTLVRVAPPGTPLEDGVIDFHTALAAQPDDRLAFGAPGQGDDVVAYFHTGGTTGAPKLVAHTHRSQLAATLGGAALAGMVPGDVLTASLPLFHVGGTIFCALSGFLAGIELVVMSPGGMRNPAMVNRFWHICERYGVTLAGAVPTSLGAVLDVPVGDANIRSIRAGFCGAASLPLAVGERFRQVTGVNLYEIYGMTEASGLVCIDPTAGPSGVGSVGFALPYTQVRVRRLNADGSPGEDCAEGEVGVLTVHGPHVSPGYRNPGAQPGRLHGRWRPQLGRPGLPRRHRPHPHRRPGQGPDHPQRPQHRPADDRERDAAAPGGGAGRGRGRARRVCRRTAGVLRDAARRCDGHRGRTARARGADHRRAPGLAAADPFRRCHPADHGRQDLQAAAAMRRGAAAGEPDRLRANGHRATPRSRCARAAAAA